MNTPFLFTNCHYRFHSVIQLPKWSSILGVPDEPFNFSKARSWDDFSNSYIKKGKNQCLPQNNTLLYLMESANQWEYGESFLFSPTTQSVTFIRKNCRNNTDSNSIY